MKNVFNPFYYEGPIQPKSAAPYIYPTGIDEVVDSLIERELNILVGPPGSGTSTMMWAVRDHYLDLVKGACWWDIDLKTIPSQTKDELFSSLATRGSALFPNQDDNWRKAKDERAFLNAIAQSAYDLKYPIILAIDHVEYMEREIANSVVQIAFRIYRDWSRISNFKRTTSVILAGSSRLYRQSAEEGSPLLFAKKFMINDLSLEDTKELIQSASISSDWSFSDKAISYLFEMTNGDKYLIQKFASDMVRQWYTNPTDKEIDQQLVEKVIDDFISKEYFNEPRLGMLIPSIIADEDTLMLIDIVNKNPNGADYADLLRSKYPVEIRRMLKHDGYTVTFRNQVYEQIIENNSPVLEAALRVHRNHREKLSRTRKIQSLISLAEMASSNNANFRSLITEIAELTHADEGAILISFDMPTQDWICEANTNKEIEIEEGQPIEDTLLDKLALYEEISQVSTSNVNYSVPALNDIAFLRLRLGNDNETIGYLGLFGNTWVLKESDKLELKEFCTTLATTLRNRSITRGIQKLLRIDIDPNNEEMCLQEICEATALILNSGQIGLFRINQEHKGATLLSSIGFDENVSLNTTPIVDRLKREDQHCFIDSINGKQFVISDSLINLSHPVSFLLLAFRYCEEEIGVILVGSISTWRPSTLESTLAELICERVKVILSGLKALKVAKINLEKNQQAVQMLTHELKRWPTTINLQLGNLLLGKYGEITPRQLIVLEEMRTCIRYDLELIERLLDAEKLEAQLIQPKLKTQPIQPIVKTVVSIMTDKLEHKEISITLMMDEEIHTHDVDEVLFSEALINLIENSVQYAGGGEISVIVKHTQDATIVIVQDHGPGIDERYRVQIYERYDRGALTNTHERRAGNLGLGLFIVDKIMDLHNGTIKYDTEYQDGARFIMAIPIMR